MKNIIASVLLLFCLNSFAQSKKVRIKLVQYISYCNESGSAKELKNTPNKSTVYANKKLIVISGDHIDTITTDKSGYIKESWAYGTYLAFEPWKYYKKIPKGFSELNLDMDCLQKEWLKEDLKIVVSKKTTTVANNIILIKCPDEFTCLSDHKNQHQ
jgi:hypothetical protein